MFEYNLRPALLATVIDEAVGAHELQAAAAGIHLSVECDPVLRSSYLLMDASRIGQVITNFLSNAIKFSGAGSTVGLRAAAAAERLPAASTAGGGSGAARWDVRVSVRDAGRGMSPDELARLFQPYTQIRAAEMQSGCVPPARSRTRAVQPAVFDTATRCGSGGTGLGLALSRHFIEAGHGGTIGATSGVSRGGACAFLSY
jgi:signal transduction histidine kinase